MIRNLLLVGAFLGVFLVPASTLLAGQDGRGITVRGVIERINYDRMTFIMVARTDAGRIEIPVKATDDTLIIDRENRERIRFRALHVGDHVTVRGMPRHDHRHRWLQARLIVRY